MCRRRWCSSVVGCLMIALAGILLCPPSAAGQDGWTWQHPLPQGNSLNGIWGSSASNIFAVGDAGTIIHFDGTAWSTMPSSITGTLRAVWGSSGTNIFAVGERGTIVRYDGTAWIAMSSGVTNTLNSVWGSSGSDVFAVGEAGTILHYAGAGWSAMAGSGGSLVGVLGNSASDVFAIGATGAIFHYDGTAWSALPTDTSQLVGQITAIWGSSAGIYAVTDEWGSPILHYTGTAWELVGSFGPAYGIWGTSAADIFVVGFNGELTHFNGSGWTYTATGNPGLNAVWGSSSNNVFAVGSSGTILHYDGTSWTNISSLTNTGLHGIWGRSGSDVFTVGEEATILHYDGSQWAAMPSGVNGFLAAVWGTGANDVYAVGTRNENPNSLILHYDGSNWSPMTSGTLSSLYDVWGSGARDIYAIGYDAKLVHYDGTQWTEVQTGIYGESFSAIWGSSATDIYVVGTSINHYDGQGWIKVPLNTMAGNFTDIWGSSSTDIYVIGSVPGLSSSILVHFDGVNWGPFSPANWQPDRYSFSTVWGSGRDDVFISGTTHSVGPTPSEYIPTIWHYDGVAWTATTYPTSVPAAGWSNRKNDAFAVGSLSIMHYSGPLQPVSVAKNGNGSGAIQSIPAGIACGSICNAAFTNGITVVLTATADAGSIFAGWSGACTGTASCILTMEASKSVTATFDVEGAIYPQAERMYYGAHLKTGQGAAASSVVTTTQLVVFTGSIPPGLYLVGVEGSEPYATPITAFRLVNRLLQTGCNNSTCSAVNCAYYSPVGKRTDLVVTEWIATDHVYLPAMQKR